MPDTEHRQAAVSVAFFQRCLVFFSILECDRPFNSRLADTIISQDQKLLTIIRGNNACRSGTDAGHFFCPIFICIYRLYGNDPFPGLRSSLIHALHHLFIAVCAGCRYRIFLRYICFVLILIILRDCHRFRIGAELILQPWF